MFGKDAKSDEAVEPPPSSPPLPSHRGTPSIFRRFSTTSTEQPSVTTLTAPVVTVTEPEAQVEPELSSQSEPPPDESFSPSFLRRLTSDIAANPNSPSLIRRLNHKLQGSDTSYQSNPDDAVPTVEAVTEPTLSVTEPIEPGPIATPSLFRRVSQSLWSSPRPVRRAEEQAEEQAQESNQPSESVSEQVEVQFAPKEEKKSYRTLTRSMSNLSLFKDRKKKRRRKKKEEEELFDMNKEEISFAFLGSAKFVNSRYKDTSLVVYKGWKKSVIKKRKDNGELPKDDNYSVDVLKKTEDKPGCEVM